MSFAESASCFCLKAHLRSVREFCENFQSVSKTLFKWLSAEGGLARRQWPAGKPLTYFTSPLHTLPDTTVSCERHRQPGMKRAAASWTSGRVCYSFLCGGWRVTIVDSTDVALQETVSGGLFWSYVYYCIWSDPGREGRTRFCPFQEHCFSWPKWVIPKWQLILS